jgi:hypothetical protein
MAAAQRTSKDHTIRVISVYATKWRFTGVLPEIERFKLGQLEEFYNLYKDQLPQVIGKVEFDGRSLQFEPTPEELAAGIVGPIAPEADGVQIQSVVSRLFVLPSDQVVAAYDFEIVSQMVAEPSASPETAAVDPLPVIRLLERCAYARLIVGGRPLEQHIAGLLGDMEDAKEVRTLEANEAGGAVTEPFPPERHQIVFATKIRTPLLLPARPGNEADDSGLGPDGGLNVGDDATIQQILYRIEPPNRPEFAEYERPQGLNHRGTLCAVTPFVSLLSDHPDYLENSVFLTVVQAVGTAARFRHIWHKAHGEVRKFRREGQAERSGTQSRDSLEYLADELGNLELDLSFSVETSSDLGLLIPSLRIESYHRVLYEALELQERAKIVSRMFNRLEATIRSELTAIEIRDRRTADEQNQKDEDRRLRWQFSIGIVSFIAIPLGFLGAFFGLNVKQVHPDWSLFDYRHYWVVYLVAAFLTAIPPLTWWLLGIAVPRRNRDRSRPSG